MRTHTNTSGEVSLLPLTVTREIKEANVCQTPIPRHPRNRVVLIVLPSLPLAVQWLVEEPWRSSQAKWLDVGGGGEGREVRKMSALMFSLAEDVQGSGFFVGTVKEVPQEPRHRTLSADSGSAFRPKNTETNHSVTWTFP